MKRLTLQGCIYLLSAATVFGQGTATRPHHRKQVSKRPAVVTVLVCGSRSAYAYHSAECHGLARCRSGVSRVSVSEARNMGYVPCKICY